MIYLWKLKFLRFINRFLALSVRMKSIFLYIFLTDSILWSIIRNGIILSSFLLLFINVSWLFLIYLVIILIRCVKIFFLNALIRMIFAIIQRWCNILFMNVVHYFFSFVNSFSINWVISWRVIFASNRHWRSIVLCYFICFLLYCTHFIISTWRIFSCMLLCLNSTVVSISSGIVQFY